VLAYARSLQVDGVLIPLEKHKPGLGRNLRHAFVCLQDKTLDDPVCDRPDKACFHRYERIALAEILLSQKVSGESKSITRAYADFSADLRNNARLQQQLQPAVHFVTGLNAGEPRAQTMKQILVYADCLISATTSIEMPKAMGSCSPQIRPPEICD
jgi:hypothetical protein